MVLPKAKSLKDKLLLRNNAWELSETDVKAARQYIAAYWPKLTRYHPKDDESLLGLPNPYLVPAFEEGHEFDFNELYYWDSFFMVQGIMDQKHQKLVVGILEDLLTLFKRFSIIPNASRTYLMGRSQPPFLTSFILEVYQTYKLDKKWLADAMKLAEAEYNIVWMGTTKPNARLVYKGLSRYYDINYLNDLAEAESGWDLTTRFGRKALNYVPVDLNSLLYKYEMDFAYAAREIGKNRKATEWETVARIRKQNMHQLMWSEIRGMYFDYDYTKHHRSGVASLAAYYTMWAGLATPEEARRMVGLLRKFEEKGGLTATDGPQIGQLVPGSLPAQWAHPNGWAPLHYIVVKGLQKYGYHDDARRVAMKWLKTNLDWFNKHGVFLEKYNVVQPGRPPVKGVYPSQTGFGWTNSVFECFCKEFIDKN